MLTALVADLAATGRHQIVTTADPRFPRGAAWRSGRDAAAGNGAARLDALIAAADAVWLVAPETDRCLERLAVRVERKGKMLLGPGSAAIRRRRTKPRSPAVSPDTASPTRRPRVLPHDSDWRAAAREIGYPIVVKPARGAGCDGVYLARDGRELHDAMNMARRI